MLLLVILVFSSNLSAQTTVFSEDFEGTFPASGAWTVGDADAVGVTAYWGAVDSAFGGADVHGGTHKAYCAGVGFSGTTATPS